MNRFALVALLILLFVAGCGGGSVAPTPHNPEPERENRPPSLELVQDVATGTAPLDVVFTAKASDPDGDSLQYFWEVGVDTGKFGEAVLRNTFYEAGSRNVAITVTDGRGGSVTKVATVVVEKPVEPYIVTYDHLERNAYVDAFVWIWWLRSEEALGFVDIEATCVEATYGNLTTVLKGVASFPTVNSEVFSAGLSYSSGFPYFTDQMVSCAFEITTRDGHPVELVQRVPTADPLSTGTDLIQVTSFE